MTLPILPECLADGGLVVRRWTVADAPALHATVARNVEHLRPWMPWVASLPETVAERAERIAEWEQVWRAGGDVLHGVFVDGVVAGGTGLHRRVGPHGLEIGYWIDGARTGRGLATRVAHLLTTAAFGIPGITHVKIACDAANRASARVPEKLGYRYLGLVAVPALAPAETGLHRLYRVNGDDWAVRPALR